MAMAPMAMAMAMAIYLCYAMLSMLFCRGRVCSQTTGFQVSENRAFTRATHGTEFKKGSR